MGKQKYHKINVSPAMLRYTAGLFHSWALVEKSVISASRLSDDDDGKNDGLKWKLEESFR
jgi:hypothetical protein